MLHTRPLSILRYLTIVSLCFLAACKLGGEASRPEQAAVPVSGPEHQTVPIGLPSEDSLAYGDQDTSGSATKKAAPDGDRFLKEIFERPFNANTMDTYFPYLDIQDVSIFQDEQWFYGVIEIKNADGSGTFPGTYGLELDLDLDGRGDWLILAAAPAAGDWSTAGVKVWEDSNKDVGGELILASDEKQNGDGFDRLEFDQGEGADADLGWARVVDGNTVQVAFKQSLLAGDTSLLVSAWAGMEALNPAWFDLNDHFTHEQAGAADPGFPLFYPIKALEKLDSTCRMPVGLAVTGAEPGLCPTYIPKDAPPPVQVVEPAVEENQGSAGYDMVQP